MEYLEGRVNDQVTFSNLVRQIQDFCGEKNIRYGEHENIINLLI